jgi:hypothetical protein
MRHLSLPLFLLLLSACSPALNWRDVQLPAGMRGMLPCKPDQTQQVQNLAGHRLQVQMMGCDAGDALWALASVDLEGAAAGRAVEVQAAWQSGLAQALQSPGPAIVQSHALRSDPGEPGLAVTLTGRSPEGRPLQAQALWFLRGQRLHLAVVYAQRVTPEMLETFWDNVRSR